MPASRTIVLLAALYLLSACFHATIETGLTPSTQVLERKWASSWIYGLVPPKTVETASRCPDGVAKVETQLSFLNQVVQILTLGIYTPMDIRVTCALPAGTSAPQGAMLTLPADADSNSIRAAFSAAAEQAAEKKVMVLVRFDR
ncbi:MAG TPA: Bor family protein [Gemmatimonadales bacterium]|nr:Bor family protein [Gemmatimonadales bacterium]